MANARTELCGSCCQGSHPTRKSFCACGAPLCSQNVVENNLPTDRRCLIEIPMEFMEDHGSRLLVQVYKLGKSNPIVTPPVITPKVEDHDDDIEVCGAHDWLVAKASRTNTANTNPVLPSKLNVEKVFAETSNRQARQKHRVVPNDFDLERMDVSDGIVEAASDSSRRKKKFDSETIHEGHSLQERTTTRRELRYEPPVLKTPAQDQGGPASPQASPPESSSDSEENGDSDASSDSASPGKSHSSRGRKGSAANFAAYIDREDEDEDDEDGVEDDQVLNQIAGKKRSSAADGSSSSDEMKKRKRGRPSSSTRIVNSETDLASPADDDEMDHGTTHGLLVEGRIIKRHDWHKPGTKRGRTYVSRRRPVTESEKVKTLEKAKQVQLKLKGPRFSKQLRKDSCYRSLKLSPPTPFYRESMVSATKGSYKATLIDQEGKSWPTNIRGMNIYWKNFTLDHYLEEDDVVIFQLVDPRPESVTFLVHIFRVVDVKVTLTGKAGWAVNYNVVEGTKKQYFKEKRRLAQAQRLKKLQKQKQKQKLKQKQKRKDESSNAEIDTEFTEFFRGKKKQPSVVTEVYKRLATSQGKSRELQKEKHASDSPDAEQLEDQHRRPTTRNSSREMNQNSGELNTTPNKSVGSVKQGMEDAPFLATAGTFFGNVGNSVITEPNILEEVFGGEDSD